MKNRQIQSKNWHGKSAVTRALALLLLAALILSGCGNQNSAVLVENPATETVFALDTVISITYYFEKDRPAVLKALDSLKTYERIFSRTIADSELSKLNAGDGRETVVSEDLFTVLSKAWEISEKTGGALDCTLGAVSDLYGFSSKEYRVPSDAELAQTLSHAGYKKVHLDSAKHSVRIDDPAFVIDLGAIAKGYIADRLKSDLVKAGVTSAIINLGGNVLLIGGKGLANKEFSIGIKNPDDEKNYFEVLKVRDESVVTSGNYERCFKVGDTLYHHLLDPATGRPAQTELVSVTVECADSMTADALSTAAFVLGIDEAGSLLAAFPGIRLHYVTEDREVFVFPD